MGGDGAPIIASTLIGEVNETMALTKDIYTAFEDVDRAAVLSAATRQSCLPITGLKFAAVILPEEHSGGSGASEAVQQT